MVRKIFQKYDGQITETCTVSQKIKSRHFYSCQEKTKEKTRTGSKAGLKTKYFQEHGHVN